MAYKSYIYLILVFVLVAFVLSLYYPRSSSPAGMFTGKYEPDVDLSYGASKTALTKVSASDKNTGESLRATVFVRDKLFIDYNNAGKTKKNGIPLGILVPANRELEIVFKERGYERGVFEVALEPEEVIEVHAELMPKNIALTATTTL